jgi:hypothetical protein
MGFFKDTAASIKADIHSGDTARIEKAADALVYALLEGPGTAAENMDALTKAAKEARES